MRIQYIYKTIKLKIMTTIEIQNFLLTKGKFLPMDKIDEVTTKLQNIEEGSKTSFRISSLNFKNPLSLTLLYWLVPGFALIDRFFTKDVTAGFKKFLIILGMFILSFTLNKVALSIDPLCLGGGTWIDYLPASAPGEVTYVPSETAHSLVVCGGLINLGIIVGLIIDGFFVYNRVKKQNFTALNITIK